MKFGDLATTLKDLTAFKATEDLKRASLPASPDKYELKLPNGFKLPDGYDFKFNDADPRLPELRKLAHEAGLDQGGFSRLLGIHAAYTIGEDQQIAAARKAEIDKLGANGPARVDAVTTFLKAKLGADKGGAIMERMVKSTDLEALEDLVKLFSSQNVIQFDQRHRENASASTFDEAEYEKLPVGSTARLEYMQKHAPKNAANGR